jgi:membrane protein
VAGRAAPRRAGRISRAIRFVVRDGSYHAATLTYYSILAVFPAGALVYGLLGLVGAESVIDDAVDALERRDVESQFADALRDTLSSAANQRSDEATIAVAISVGAAVYVASRWVRGIARGLDAVLGREHKGSGLRFLRQLRDTLVLMLLFVGALLLLFVGAGLANDLFGEALSLL